MAQASTKTGKPKTKTTTVAVRVAADKRAEMERVASECGMTLSAFVAAAVDKAVEAHCQPAPQPVPTPIAADAADKSDATSPPVPVIAVEPVAVPQSPASAVDHDAAPSPAPAVAVPTAACDFSLSPPNAAVPEPPRSFDRERPADQPRQAAPLRLDVAYPSHPPAPWVPQSTLPPQPRSVRLPEPLPRSADESRYRPTQRRSPPTPPPVGLQPPTSAPASPVGPRRPAQPEETRAPQHVLKKRERRIGVVRRITNTVTSWFG